MKKNQEKILFLLTIVFMIMLGIAFNIDINKGLKQPTIQTMAIHTIEIERFSPEPILNFIPLGSALFLITLAVIKKETNIKIRPKIKSSKRFLKNLLKSVHNKIEKMEAERVRELFIANYREEFTGKFIAILLIVAVTAMSIFAITPFNKGIIREEKIAPVITPLIQKEIFSPEPLLNFWPLIGALVIVAIASYLKLKNEK
jgi:uncharacterized membrane protein YqgA involved in biofilm formation